jgi:hypothetical protein
VDDQPGSLRRRTEAAEPCSNRPLARTHPSRRPGVLRRQLTMLSAKAADGVEHLGVALGVFRQPLQRWSAEYAGWVRIGRPPRRPDSI